MKKISTMLTLLIISTQIFAGGFQLNEHGAKAMGMGGAYTAVSNDASAIYWNAAGLTQLSGTNFLFGSTLIAPVTTFRGVAPEITEYKMEKQVFFPTHFFVSHSFSKDLAAGLGFTSPFGLGTKWGEDWIGRYLAVETELQVFTISPVVAYKLTDELSVSAGFVYSFANVTITKKVPQTPFAGDAFIQLNGKDNFAAGYNFGLMYKPIPKLSFGLSFHSQVSYEFKGTTNTTGAQAKRLPEGGVKAKLKTPLNLAFGAAYDVMPDLKLSFDFQYVGWSSYDSLIINFDDPAYGKSVSPRLYDNSYIIRLGGDYKLYSDLEILAGVYFDKNPVKDEYVNPSLPDANRWGFSFGAEYKLTSQLNLSASYLFIRNNQLTVTDSKESYTSGEAAFNGTYNSIANLVSLSLSYSL
jgi:long-chain fatty acid transport protein